MTHLQGLETHWESFFRSAAFEPRVVPLTEPDDFMEDIEKAGMDTNHILIPVRDAVMIFPRRQSVGFTLAITFTCITLVYNNSKKTQNEKTPTKLKALGSCFYNS